jgi:lipopolysaccharide transport system ATP-binding protein
MSDIAVRIENLSKLYHIGARQEQPDMFREWLIGKFKRSRYDARDENLWALRDVSFDVKRGQVVGVIGRNGAGKSTLLKILSRITEPTSGRVELNGRVGSLLEVGTGFHPELTGRENVYLSGAILGMHRVEIDKRFDEIVDFSGVEKFLDTPYKRYSNGMKVRLGFAVAAHLDPEIMLIDEVLAVGDLSFQKKCLGKMSEVAGEGRTVVFVSHNLAAVSSLCSDGYLLDNGKITYQGDAPSTVKNYLDSQSSQEVSKKTFFVDREVVANQMQSPLNGILVHDIELLSSESDFVEEIHTGDTLTFRIHYKAQQKLISPSVQVKFFSQLGNEVARLSTMPLSGYYIDYLEGEGYIDLLIQSLPFTGGTYYLTLEIFQPRIESYLRLDNIASIEISPTDFYRSGYALNQDQGIVALNHRWSVNKSTR